METMLITADTKLLVQNSNSSDLPPFSIEDYGKIRNMPSNMICPGCNNRMFRQKDHISHKDKRFIVCGHVELTTLPIFKYVTLICNKCNSEKTNLDPFEVQLGNLIPISEVYRLAYKRQHQKT